MLVDCVTDNRNKGQQMRKIFYKDEFDEEVLRDGEICNVLEKKESCQCCGRGAGITYWLVYRIEGKTYWNELEKNSCEMV